MQSTKGSPGVSLDDKLHELIKIARVEYYTTYQFSCPYCNRFWAFGTDVSLDLHVTNELKQSGLTYCDCKCGNTFIARIED